MRRSRAAAAIIAGRCDIELGARDEQRHTWKTRDMPDAPPSPPHTILVGLDGSDMSHRAAAYAAMLANAFGSDVVAAHAVGLLSVIDGESVPSDQVRDRIEEACSSWCAPLSAAGVTYRTVLDDGPPGLVLLRLIERTGAGMAVMGTRGIGSAEGVVLGSTSYHLVQHSPVPVLVTH
ncbi:MAG: universal stress protein [Acidimicrobiales bacterium]|nr:universal stress protein [Acidimicrobiales bacterium]